MERCVGLTMQSESSRSHSEVVIFQAVKGDVPLQRDFSGEGKRVIESS